MNYDEFEIGKPEIKEISPSQRWYEESLIEERKKARKKVKKLQKIQYGN